MKYLVSDLERFIWESNLIEGIRRAPTTTEIEAHRYFLEQTRMDLSLLETFVSLIAPGHKLRREPGMDVRVGDHLPPAGGPLVQATLEDLCRKVRTFENSPILCYRIHHDYETLQPFTDGNGRSGRVLWLWMMGGPDNVPLGFLHHWYYQSLQFGGTR